MDFVNLAEAERRAAEILPPAALAYYAGGAEDEVTLQGNAEAWRRLRIAYRVLVDVSRRSLSTELLGSSVSTPVGIAPTAFHRLAHPDAEAATARAAAAEGALLVVSTLSSTRLEEVAAASGDGVRWLQLYVQRDRSVSRALVSRAERSGYGAIVLTVDTPVLGRRERDVLGAHKLDVRPANFETPGAGAAPLHEIFGDLDASLSWRDLRALAAETSLPVVVKGVVHPEDARLAVEAGAAGVVVSNHGGRQLDSAVATADALPAVVRAVGARAEVLVDGGVRRGTDVLKALALGADGALVGRPALWGLACGGEEGVRGVLRALRRELDVAMALAGAPDVEAARRVALVRASDVMDA